MKTYSVIMLIVLCPFFLAEANIFNGYLIEKHKLEKQLKYHTLLLDKAGTEKSRKQIEKELKHLQREYESVTRKFQDTEALISTVKQIDSDLYEAVSMVTNAEGTLTHVYVRCVSRLEKEFADYVNYHFNAKAYTSVSMAKDNEHACCSKYGTNTVTTTIAKNESEIIALAHEFAHVLYVVPNLKTYTAFINRITNGLTAKSYGRGHHPCDPSRQFMETIENRFKDNYLNYLNNPESDKVL